MELRARDHIPMLTGVLSTVSLALVFGAVLGAVPRTALPHAPHAIIAGIPHVNALISVAAIATIATGWRRIRRGDIATHRRRMLAAAGLFATFLVLYLYRVTLEGPTTFPGPDAIATYVYYPMLAIHIFLAIVCIPLLYYVLLLGLTIPPTELTQTNHARIGRIAASLWLISFTLGVFVYGFLYVLY